MLLFIPGFPRGGCQQLYYVRNAKGLGRWAQAGSSSPDALPVVDAGLISEARSPTGRRLWGRAKGFGFWEGLAR